MSNMSIDGHIHPPLICVHQKWNVNFLESAEQSRGALIPHCNSIRYLLAGTENGMAARWLLWRLLDVAITRTSAGILHFYFVNI